MNDQVKQALAILEQVVDASTAQGVFKKASEAAMVAQALVIVSNALTPIEKEIKKVKK